MSLAIVPSDPGLRETVSDVEWQAQIGRAHV